MDATREQENSVSPWQHSRSGEEAVHARYASAAAAVEPALCCPVEYNREYLRAIPAEILERDYGCGDPSPFVLPGDTVLDLGSGGGKLCYILSQLVGPRGRVIGVDCNVAMLQLARRYQADVAARVGYANVDFRYGMIQDLRLDLDRLGRELGDQPVRSAREWMELRAREETLRREHPLVPDHSVDCVVSNCVLNLVRREDRERLFGEIFRVLKVGGRAAISDIVADEEAPEHLRRDPELWSGCISGAYREDRFLQAFLDAGFHGVQIARWQSAPWRVVEGIEFRSVTVLAYKGKQGPCLERNQAVIYRGPFRRVEDDDGHAYRRGERTAVCDKTYRLLQQAPYAGLFEAIEPREEVPLPEAAAFDCRRSARRHPRETKGMDYQETTEAPSAACDGDGPCC
jgi:SAM-dependent methyltransferase